MKKNIFYRLYAAVFVGACLAPAALAPFVKADGSKEKRELAKAPKITEEDGGLNFEFFEQFEDYFSDRFAFRQKLVNADGRLKATLLGTSPNPDVIVGKEGWLYYGPTKNDYLRVNGLSERGIENIAANIALTNEICEASGKRFVFTIATNKASVYPEYTPFNYVPCKDKNNYERVAELLKDKSYWRDLREAILAADSSVPLYHKTDTHWNNMGAYVAYTALMETLGKPAISVGSRWETRYDRLGDLAAMIYPDEEAQEAQLYCDREFKYVYRGRFRALDDITIRTACEGAEGSLMMFRDSFGEAILPFMSESFASAEYSRAVPYDISASQADTVVVEIVERNLGNIQKYAPVAAAPEAEAPEADGLYSGDNAELRSGLSGSFVHFYGVLPEACFTGDKAEIFFTSGGKTYKAFNCFEDVLLGREGETCDNGFSLYIPVEAASPDAPASATVRCEGGRTIRVDFN